MCYHSLVELVMGSETSSDMASKEQAWTVLEEVINLIESRPSKVYLLASSTYEYSTYFGFVYY